MEEDRICPLMSYRSALSDAGKELEIDEGAEVVRCFVEKCAWYDFIEKQCCLMTISMGLEKLQDTIGAQEIKS